MYVIRKKIIFEKGYAQTFLTHSKLPQAVLDFDGFIKRDVLYTETKEHDIVEVNLYWQDQDAHKRWQVSDAHKNLHKEGSHQEPKGVLSVTKEKYTLYHTDLK